MPIQNLREQTVARKADCGSSQFLPAVVYTSDCVLRGKIRSETSGSLADILNDSPYSPLSESMNAFLPLFAAEALSTDGSREHIQSTYVRKENILFAAQSKPEMMRWGRGGKSKPHSDEKDEEVLAVAYLPSHILVGKLEADAWHALAHDLGCRQRFLSLSEVRVSSHSTEGETRYALAAVNSNRILHITQLPGESDNPPDQLTIDGILSELLGLKCDRNIAKRPAAR